MPVYVIAEIGRPVIKIGFAKDVDRRVKAIKSANPFVVHILTLVGDMSIESALHAVFEQDRIGGEWFAVSKRRLMHNLEAAGAKIIKDNTSDWGIPEPMESKNPSAFKPGNPGGPGRPRGNSRIRRAISTAINSNDWGQVIKIASDQGKQGP